MLRLSLPGSEYDGKPTATNVTVEVPPDGAANGERRSRKNKGRGKARDRRRAKDTGLHPRQGREREREEVASIVARSADSGADQEFQHMQEVVDLTDPDAPVNLDADGIFALQITLDLPTADMDAMSEVLVPMLDPRGTGTLTREAWRAVSAEWHASGESFLAFVTTTTTTREEAPGPLLVAEAEAGTQQSTETVVGTATATGTSGAAAEEEETKVTTAAADVDVRAVSSPSFRSS